MVVILRCLWWCAFVEIYNIHSQDDFNRALVCSIIKLGGNLIFSPKQCKCHVVWHVIKCNRVGTVVHNVLRHTVRLYQKRFVYIIVPCLFRYDRNLCTSGTTYVERKIKEPASADDSHFGKLVFILESTFHSFLF